MIYLRLFHGRTNPRQDMDDWGSDGPVLGPYLFAHTTYAWDIKLGKPDGNCDELYAFEDMVYYDGIYYGDWTVFNADTLEDGKYSLTEYESSKAVLPK